MVPPFPVDITFSTSTVRQSRYHESLSLRISATCKVHHNFLVHSININGIGVLNKLMKRKEVNYPCRFKTHEAARTCSHSRGTMRNCNDSNGIRTRLQNIHHNIITWDQHLHHIIRKRKYKSVALCCPRPKVLSNEFWQEKLHHIRKRV